MFYERKLDSERDENIIDLDELEIDVKRITTYKYVIHVKNNNKFKNGIVDLKVSYQSHFLKTFFNTLDIKKYVFVKDINIDNMYPGGFNNFNIPVTSNEYYLPINVINGEGEIEIYSYPYENTKLDIQNVEIVGMYTDRYRYIHGNPAKYDENKIYIDNTTENSVIIEGVTKVKMDNHSAVISDVEKNDKYIILKSNDDLSYFQYPNFFEIIKGK